MMFSFWIVWLIPILLTESDGFKQSFKPRLKTAVKAVAFGCLAVIIATNVKTANAAYVKKDLENSATLSVITDVSRLIPTPMAIRRAKPRLPLLATTTAAQSFRALKNCTVCSEAPTIWQRLRAHRSRDIIVLF